MTRRFHILLLATLCSCSVYEGPAAEGSGESGASVAATISGTASVSASDVDSGDSTLGGGSGDSGAAPPEFVEIGIHPPDTLVLDGQSISAGELRIRSVEIADATVEWMTLLDPDMDPPVLKQANIGAGEYHPLFMVPGDTQLMRIAGEFDAAVPDLPPAAIDMIVVGAIMQPVDLTVFLASLTNESCTQVTGLGTDPTQSDNVDVFCAVAPSDIAAVVEDAASGMLAVGQPPLSQCACNSAMTSHGTVSSNGGCGFMCPDGGCVAANTACNGAMDCPGGEDEDPATCGDERSCCIATMGCPDESGADCGETCCCCPGGQACCPDPNDGCCAAG